MDLCEEEHTLLLCNEWLLFLPGVEFREFFCRNATPVQKDNDGIP